jgi:hypothetical protein
LGPARLSRAEALSLLRLVDSPVLAREDATEAFRRRAKQSHPDMPGGNAAEFKRHVEAMNLLAELLPTQEELLRIRTAMVDERLERQFAARGGSGALLAAPRGIWQKTTLAVREALSDRIMRVRSGLGDAAITKFKSEARPVEATGAQLTTAEELELEREMADLKLDELRTKGVSRMVDKLISDAMRDGKFHIVPGKGQKIPEDYYEAHLATGSLLERKLMEKLKDGGYEPEWIELRKKLDADVAELKDLVRGRLEWLMQSGAVKTTAHSDVVLASPEVQVALAGLSSRTRRFNALCPPALQRTSGSSQWASVLIETEMETLLSRVRKEKD